MLFISHKTEDKEIANEVLRRALEHGYSDKQIFLDSDPGSGIEAGAQWESRIYESLKHTRAMIVLCSPNWLKSQWCYVEIGYAKAMAISVFPIVIEPCEVGSALSATQAVDLTRATDAAARDAAFDRLWTALDVQHLGPKDNLPWPPPGETDNCPFPGLMCFAEKHAPVFFGREQERDAVIQQLQKMRSSGMPRLLMIVGGSGSGKSSLLRAGVLPWLKHPTERNDWLVLPTLRFGEIPNDDVTLLARLAEVIAESYPPNHPQRPAWKDLRDKFESDDIERAARDFVDAALDLCHARHTTASATASTPTLLLAIDQFEELLTAATRRSALKFLRFLGTLLSRSNDRLLVIGTMRSDYLDTWEQHAESLKPPFLDLYRLPLFPWERVTDVITKPAERVDVTFSDELITRLKGDAPNSDALPQLAFTLEKLFRQCAGDKLVALREYEQLGGINGAITQAVTRILPRDMPKEIAQAVRLSFVKHLAQVNENDEFVRRTARWSDLPHAAKPLLEQFVRERLLHRSGGNGEQIEVSHEAIFRSWDRLTKWLNESRQILRWRRDIDHDRNTAPDSWQGLTRSQLAVARKWPHDRPDELSPDETKWIKRGIRRERLIRGLVAGVMLVILALGAGAWWEKTEADSAKHESQDYLITSRFRLADSEIQNGQLARGIFSYWQAYEDARIVPADLRPERARHLIGSVSGGLGQPLLHDDPVYAVAFSPDGSTVVTGCADNAARLWDVATYQPRGPLLSHEGQVLAVAFSEDGKMVLTGSADKTAKLWDAQTGKLLHTLTGHQRRILAVAFSPDSRMVLTGSVDRTARLWDAQTSQCQCELIGHQRWVSAVAFSPDGKTVLTGSYDTTARLWDAKTGKAKEMPVTSNPIILKGHDRGVSAVAFSPDGNTLLTGSWDKTARLWDAQKFEEKKGMDPLQHEGWVSSVAFSPDGETVLTGSYSGTARLWDAGTGKPMGEPLRHERWVNAVAFHPKEKKVLTGSSDGTARLWDVPAARTMWHADSVTAVAFSPNGEKVLTGSWDFKAKLWDAATGELQFKELAHGRGANAVAFSPDGLKLLTGSYDTRVRLWDEKTGEESPVKFSQGNDLPAHDDGVTAVAFSPDGQTVLTGSWDQTARLWNAKTGELIRTLKDISGVTHHDGVTAAAFSGDGRVITGSPDKTARIWNAETGALLPLEGTIQHEDGITAVAFSADGKTVISGSYDGTARLWDSSTGKPGFVLLHDDWVTAVAFSRDSQRVLTGSFDGTARLWDASTGKQWGEPMRHEGPVFAVGFSPVAGDWRMLTGSREDRARIWNLPIPAADEPKRLRLSVEVRTTYSLDSNGDRKRLRHAEWLRLRQELTVLGDSCDVRSHKDLSEAEKQQLDRPTKW